MADPPAGGPEPSPTNTQRGAPLFSLENFEPSIVPRKRRSPRNGNDNTTASCSNPEFAGPEDNNGRVTTKEVRQLINSLKEIINNQTALIESAKTELLELYEEIRALRTQRNQATDHTAQNMGRSSSKRTPRTVVDPVDNESSDVNAFGRYLPTETANTGIRTALLNAPSTQDAQVAGIGTIKTGYVIRFKDTELADASCNNIEWLNELGNNTRPVKPRFGLVMHRTLTEDFDLENANSGAIEKLWKRTTSQAWNAERLRRSDVNSLVTWRGRAKKYCAVDIVQASMSANGAYQVSEHGA
ncbi:reverse transcriptase [Aspergillus terreus]|uniref:Reverse transcriptase n=1 Tax=Aspergillus terreus TaxID=33178 RepID=A0A5M3ZDF8_ASPTE|nr:hypothetical protein ATETN484_0012039900 [Aspergillus terreus]GFF19637.1 reverse transcriptase [Aspergillus terreus]